MNNVQLPKKQSMLCELINNNSITNDIFQLDFIWPQNAQAGFAAPRAGQFFMIKPKKSAVFLGRPISMSQFLESNTVRFLVAVRGKGTLELSSMRSGEEAELIGPLGNSWEDFLPAPAKNEKPIALIGGGIGVAPLLSLLCEESEYTFDLYAGFKNVLNSVQKDLLLGAAFIKAENTIIAAENSKEGHKGFITDFVKPENYAAICACGPEPMLKTIAVKCAASGVPCFISMERQMACGVGACLGCTITTVNGNRRCCADGPVFNSQEVIFNE